MKFTAIVVVVLMFAAAAQATTQVTFSEVAFTSQLGTYYLEGFTGWTYGSPYNANVTTASFGPVNGFSWDAYAAQGIWSNVDALSTNNALDTLLITFTGAPVTAVGGMFMSTAIGGNPISQMFTLQLADGTTASWTGTGFVGFISDVPILWMTVDGIDVPNNNWPAIDYLYVGAGVPEPASMLLLGTGLAGLLARKLRK